MKKVLAILLTVTASAAQALPVEGDWLTDDRSAVIRVASCGSGRLCGTILRVLDPAAPPNDANNPDPARRRRSLAGVMVLDGFVPAGRDRWTDGTAYDPKAGRSYRSRLALVGRTLDVTGCVLFLCRTKRWTRAD